jgi:hypothetical protein
MIQQLFVPGWFSAKASLVLAAAVMVAAAGAQQPDSDSDEQGWRNLLPESNLSQHWHTTGNWQIGDQGVVTLTPRPGEQGWQRYDAYLWSKEKFDDFEIQFEYKVEPRGNSGFYFRVGDKSSPVEEGIEVQIYDSASRGPESDLTDHDSGGIIPGKPPTGNTAKPAGEWNQFQIRVQDNQLTVKLNGEVVNEVDLTEAPLNARPESGYIGFQDHGLPMALRDIQIRELP